MPPVKNRPGDAGRTKFKVEVFLDASDCSKLDKMADEQKLPRASVLRMALLRAWKQYQKGA